MSNYKSVHGVTRNYKGSQRTHAVFFFILPVTKNIQLLTKILKCCILNTLKNKFSENNSKRILTLLVWM